MNKISEQQFYDLLSRKLSGDANARELALLQEQLALNPQWQFLYDQVMQHGSALTDKQEHTEQAYAAHYVKMQLQGLLKEDNEIMPGQNAGSNHKKSIYRKLVYASLVAATILVVIVVTALHNNNTTRYNNPTALNEIATKKGSKSNIKLPDGSRVWLNADSKLTYAENFMGNTREVTLTGEAYFDVLHDTSRPFIIHAGKINIKVLGTAFNVRNYADDKTLETTLMRGKIEVTMTGHPDEKIILKPLEKLILPKGNFSTLNAPKTTPPGKISDNNVVLTSATYTNVDSTVAETAWVNDKMVFISQPLGKIAQELERHFAITVIFKNPEVKNYKYTGSFDNESLEKIMQLMQLSKKINFKLTDKKLVIE